MNPDFVLAIQQRVESEILPMVESLYAFVNTLPLHPAERHQILKVVVNDFERIQKLCWEGAAEISEEVEANVIRLLKQHNKL